MKVMRENMNSITRAIHRDDIPQDVTPWKFNQPNMLRLYQRFQTVIEPKALLALFATELGEIVSFDGLEYEFPAEQLHFSSGQNRHHACTYQLSIDPASLGDITFSRQQPFSEHELLVIETSLSALLYQLRNALQYRSAVKNAMTDTMTGLFNRHALEQLFPIELERSKRQGIPLSVLLIDIDHFKVINDTWGHVAGDALLTQISALLERTMRLSNTAFRFGGEEFLLMLPATTLRQARIAGERIRETLASAPLSYEGNPITITASLGAASLEDGDDLLSLIRKADRALYKAKNSGRNQLHAAEPDNGRLATDQ